MPRNGSGTYNPPLSSWNPAVPNQTISSDDWNTLRDDIATAISQSVAIDGQTTTSARVPFVQGIGVSSGSLSAPGMNFTADSDTGIYRVAENQLGIVAGGVLAMTATNTSVTFPLAVTFSGNPSFTGNVTIGDAAGDTLTVNATSTFVGPVTVPNDTITNAQLANVPTSTFKGRITASTGDPEDLTATQATSILNPVVGDSGSGGTKGLVPAPAAGDASDRKVLIANGSWASPNVAYGVISSTGTAVRVVGATTARSGLGTFTVTFSSALASANYTVLTNAYFSTSASVQDIVNTFVTVKSTTGFTIQVAGFLSGVQQAIDPDQLFFAVIV